MIYTVDARNRSAFQGQLEKIFRTQCSLEPRGNSFRPKAAELFDSTDTQYLLGIDAVGRLTSAAMLTPATGSHFLATLLTNVADNVVPADEAFELPHRQSSSASSQSKRGNVHGELVVAVLEYALALGVDEICLLYAPSENPLKSRRSSKSHRANATPNDPLTGLLVEVSYDIADNTRQRLGIKGPVLAYARAPPPYAANENQRIRIAYSE